MYFDFLKSKKNKKHHCLSMVGLSIESIPLMSASSSDSEFEAIWHRLHQVYAFLPRIFISIPFELSFQVIQIGNRLIYQTPINVSPNMFNRKKAWLMAGHSKTITFFLLINSLTTFIARIIFLMEHLVFFTCFKLD